MKKIIAIGGSVTTIFIFMFVGVWFDLVFHGPLYLSDAGFIDLLRTFIAVDATPFFILVTSLVNSSVVALAIAIGIAALLFWKDYSPGKYLALSVVIGQISTSLLKGLIQRPRPQDISYVVLPQSFSFPSGHAIMAVCLYGFLAYLVFKYFRGTIKKTMTIVFFTLLIIAIGISRVYLGVHYPSDVISGWYLGLAILAIAITSYEIEDRFFIIKDRLQKNRSLLVIICFVVFVAIIRAYYSYSITDIIRPS